MPDARHFSLNLWENSVSRHQHVYGMPTVPDWAFQDEPETEEGDYIVRLSNGIYDMPVLPKGSQILVGYSKTAESRRDIGDHNAFWTKYWKQHRANSHLQRLWALKSLSLEKTAWPVDLHLQGLESLKSLLLEKTACPLAVQPILETLNAQANANTVWTEDDLAELSEWTLKHRSEALQVAEDETIHGRLRWAVLEALAVTPNDALRETLCKLVITPDLDPWLLNGVPVVIRMTRMGRYRPRVTKALRAQLTHVRDHQKNYRDYVRECGVGELVMTFGSFAEPADFELVGGFALVDWKLKVRVCAFDSLRRMTQRLAGAKATTHFYETHREELEAIGKAWAANFRTSADDGALFFAWLTTVVSRIGPEADMVGPILKDFPRHAARLRYELKQAWSSVAEKGPEIQDRFERLDKLAQEAC